MSDDVTNSRFHMWRTIFAMAHTDDDVSPGEIRFMAEALEDLDLSKEQYEVLKNDIHEPQPIEDMFKKVVDSADQALFFKFAREMVWADGDFSPDEQEVLNRLQRMHLEFVNVDDLVGSIELEFEDDEETPVKSAKENAHNDYMFRDKFLRTLKYDKKSHEED